MGGLLTDRWASLRPGAAAAILALALVACGPMPEPATEVTPPVPLSPVAGEIPAETFQETARITDGRLEPDRFSGQIGSGYRLVITGDGQEHVLAIEGLVADTTIGASGETAVEFSISGEPGESAITLDGQRVGTFERQGAGGITDE